LLFDSTVPVYAPHRLIKSTRLSSPLLLYSTSFPLWLKITMPISQSQSTLSSRTFLNNPFFRFEKVVFLAFSSFKSSRVTLPRVMFNTVSGDSWADRTQPLHTRSSSRRQNSHCLSPVARAPARAATFVQGGRLARSATAASRRDQRHRRLRAALHPCVPPAARPARDSMIHWCRGAFARTPESTMVSPVRNGVLFVSQHIETYTRMPDCTRCSSLRAPGLGSHSAERSPACPLGRFDTHIRRRRCVESMPSKIAYSSNSISVMCLVQSYGHEKGCASLPVGAQVII